MKGDIQSHKISLCGNLATDSDWEAYRTVTSGIDDAMVDLLVAQSLCTCGKVSGYVYVC